MLHDASLPTGIEKYYLKMKNSIITRLGKSLAGASLTALAILVISSCGGGDGDDAASRNVIAPESLDEVKINFFDAFTIECYRLSGTAGNEGGAGDYDRLKEEFRYQNPDGLGIDVELPVTLQNLQYTYQRTGVDTGRVTFTFGNNQLNENLELASEKQLTPASKVLNVFGNMFWGSNSAPATDLIVDLLFTQQGEVIGNVSSRSRFLYRVTWWNEGPGTESFLDVRAEEFDANNVKFSKLDGQPVPTAYNPYKTLTDKTPSAVVMTSLDSKKFNIIVGATVISKIAFQKGTGLGPEIPGDVRAEESGTILVTDTPEVTSPPIYNGSYSYARTGGAYAKLAVEYTKTGVGLVKENYVLQFLSLDNGSYTTSTGGSGEFENDLFSP